MQTIPTESKDKKRSKWSTWLTCEPTSNTGKKSEFPVKKLQRSKHRL